jgi:hypothetical protein
VAQRVLAVLGAVVIVLVAIVVRSAIDDESDDDGSGPGEGGDGRVELICAYDLRPACDALDGVEVTYQSAATTAEHLADGSPQVDGVDGWVTTSAWLEVLESRSPGALGEGTLLATSPAVVAVDPDRTEAVRTLCAGTALWRCLGDRAGIRWGELGSGSATWGALKTGLPDADSSSGLAVLASVAAGFFGSTEFVSNDFEPSGLASWLARLAAPSDGGEDDPIWILATVQGKYTAVGDRAASVLERGVDTLDPVPAIEISVVVAPLPGGDDLPDPQPIRDGLVDFGWTSASGPAPAPTLKPGVMAALHTLWTEVTR